MWVLYLEYTDGTIIEMSYTDEFSMFNEQYSEEITRFADFAVAIMLVLF